MQNIKPAELCRTGFNSSNRCAWIISFTPVVSEPRVLRQAQALAEAGWRIVVVGYPGHSVKPDEWNFVRLENVKLSRIMTAFLVIQYATGLVLCRLAVNSKLSKIGAMLHTTSLPKWRKNYFDVVEIAKNNPDLKADIVISHDYPTFRLGYELSLLFGSKYFIDCHEYARENHAHRSWKMFSRPFVIALHDYYLTQADLVTTVCDGIASLLNNDQKLSRPVVAIRNVPLKNIQEFQPVQDTITVLYHGNITYARGIHTALQSMPKWRSEFRFVIRGNGDDDYIDYLLDLSRKLNVYERVRIEPAVAFAEIIPEANKADIGYFVHENVSRQKLYTLPNKFFEYVMAGLALCVSNLPEMAKLVNKYNLGKLVSDYSESDIAETINSFNRENIELYKKASITAAQDLNWDLEKKVMMAAYTEVLLEK